MAWLAFKDVAVDPKLIYAVAALEIGKGPGNIPGLVCVYADVAHGGPIIVAQGMDVVELQRAIERAGDQLKLEKVTNASIAKSKLVMVRLGTGVNGQSELVFELAEDRLGMAVVDESTAMALWQAFR